MNKGGDYLVRNRNNLIKITLFHRFVSQIVVFKILKEIVLRFFNFECRFIRQYQVKVVLNITRLFWLIPKFINNNRTTITLYRNHTRIHTEPGIFSIFDADYFLLCFFRCISSRISRR